MTTRFEKFIFALMVALIFASVTFLLVQAQGSPAPQTDGVECGNCHSDHQDAWLNGLHGHAFDDNIFQDEWLAQGKPGACLVCHTTGFDPQTATWEKEGVACEACHNPVPLDHPKEPMPVVRSADLCGHCHSDTRFGWQDWKVSTHYQRDMTCTVCHDPHTADVKEMYAGVEMLPAEDHSQLCITCHQEASMNFPYTAHHERGLTCVDCHVIHIEDGDREIHTVPDHSFEASLASCNKCHLDAMHGPSEPEGDIAYSEPTTSNEDLQLASVTPEPQPISPVGFAGLAGLIGLAAGMILAPWLERILRKASQKKG